MGSGLRSLIAAGLLTATTLFTAVPAAAVAAGAPPGQSHETRPGDLPQPQITDGRSAAGRLPSATSTGRGTVPGVPADPTAEDTPGDGSAGDGSAGRSQDPGSSSPSGSSAVPTGPGQSPSPSSTATGPSPSASTGSATPSPTRPTPSHSASDSPPGRTSSPARPSGSAPAGTEGTSGLGTPQDSGSGAALQSPGTSDRPSGERPGSPHPPLSPHGQGMRNWQSLSPPDGSPATGPTATDRETAGALRPPYAAERAARVARVLPFGAGLALTGLGLAFIGLRLRRR
ncbi:hypothetical protein ABZ840_05175 [Streptomyces sp. NPDC047117]|uniref:hypothetical protein n=1 Tax=Streptomyces sp. NPDC047117 TaxID=3155379 RepID=UPI0033FC7DB6